MNLRMRSLVLIVSLLCVCQYSIAQQNISLIVTGDVRQSGDRPVRFATVMLLHAKETGTWR